MKILAVADQESKFLWDYFDKEYVKEVAFIISCGDLKGEYLSFLTTMCGKDVFYVDGNHDRSFVHDPPAGCICLEDKITVVNGLRILGLGGSKFYNNPLYQYTDAQMEKRVCRLKPALRKYKGFDILVTHAPAAGIGDGTGPHSGFQVFTDMIDRYHPVLMIHGHMHASYSYKIKREEQRGSTRVINAYEKYMIDL